MSVKEMIMTQIDSWDWISRLYTETCTPEDWAKLGSGLAGLIFFAFLFLYVTAGTKNRRNVFTWTNSWLILSGIIHIWIEGSFVFNRIDSQLKNALDFYAMGDFRYGNPMEAGTAAMEAITAILDGPLCIAVAYGAIHTSSWRHPLQLVLCTMQLYGLLWFILHPYFDHEIDIGSEKGDGQGGFQKHISQDPFLFWFLVVGMNSPWAIFPVILWFNSFRSLCTLQQQLSKLQQKQVVVQSSKSKSKSTSSHSHLHSQSIDCTNMNKYSVTNKS